MFYVTLISFITYHEYAKNTRQCGVFEHKINTGGASFIQCSKMVTWSGHLATEYPTQ